MKEKRVLQTLRARVYEYLKEQIHAGHIQAGGFLDLNRIGRELEMSRTPLRDALFQLESEGFVTIYPRRGVRLNVLDLKTVRDIYEITGALESAALLSVALRFTENDVTRMSDLNDRMDAALKRGDYAAYYADNVAFHNVFLDLSENEELVRHARTQRERLYDFPKTGEYLAEWERSNLREHYEMVGFLRRGDFTAAANYLRDVHWSYSVQERFIRQFYFPPKGD